MSEDQLTLLARMAATTDKHWATFFEALRVNHKVDRICAALQLDAYTAYLPRVAQIDGFEPIVGATGLYADREDSCTFEVIDRGLPYLVEPGDWSAHPDLAFYAPVAKSNMKFPIALGGAPAVLNLWSASAYAFTNTDLDRLAPVAAEVSRSPFRLDLAPVGLALRKTKALLASRDQHIKAAA
ncbi:MAG: hypothetical protein AAF684_07725 [Pseudomonadota bacterium]